MLLIDPETGQIQDANESASRFYGYSVDQLRQMRIQQINELTPAEIKMEIQQAAAERRNFFVFRHRLADGSVHTVEVYSSPVMLHGRELLHSVIIDVFRRETLLETIAENESRMRYAERVAGFGHWILDLDKGEYRFSEGAMRVLGVDRNSYLLEELRQMILPEYRDHIASAHRALHEQDELYSVIFRFERPDGVIIDLQSQAHYDASARTVIGVLKDITDEQSSLRALKTRTMLFFSLLGIAVLVQLAAILLLGYVNHRRKKEIHERRRVETSLRRAGDILKNMQIGLHVYELEDLEDDRTLRMVAANEASGKLSGFQPEGLIGKYIDEIFPGLRAKGIPERYANVVRAGKAGEYEDVYYGEDGQAVAAYAVKAFPLPHNHVGVTFDNITERQHTEKRLLELNMAVEQSGDGIALSGMDGNIRFVNKAWADMHGYAVDELIGRHLRIFHTPEQLEKEVVPFNQRLRETGANAGEVGHCRKDGSTFTMQMTTCVVKDASGTPFGLLGTARDITESLHRREMERFDNRFRTLLSDISAQFIRVDDRFSFDKVLNSVLMEFGQLFGVDRSYFMRFSEDLSTMDNTHEWCAEGIEAQMQRIQQFPTDTMPWWMTRMLEGCPVHIPDVADLPAEAEDEKKELQAQGIVSLVCLPIRNADGKLIAFIGFDAVRAPKTWPEEQIAMLQLMAEIVGSSIIRVETTKALRASENFLSRSQQLAHLGSWRLDLARNQLYWTDEVFRIFGCKPHEFKETYEAFLGFVHPEDRDAVVAAYSRSVQEKREDYEIEHRIIRNSTGEVRFVHEHCVHEYDDVGKLVRSIGMVHDITERKHAEEEREKLQEQLIQAQKMEAIGKLAGGVAHDFNNLLMGMMGYAELCRESIADDHPIRQWLDEIANQGKRTADLTRQLLAFARKQTIAPKVLDLNDTVTSMLKMLRRLIGEDIHLLWQPGAEMWSVKMDPSQLDQILVNLCVNARDAITGVGKVTIETQNVSIDGDYCKKHADACVGSYVMLAVSDDGCGIDKETLAHIFDPFFTANGVGSGLGLATVYGIVMQNQGFINVYSEPGKGTTFRVYLPRFADEEAGQTKAAPAPSPAAGSETILLVEDEKSVRVTTALFLA